MGYTIFVGCDGTANVWQTGVKLSALCSSLQENKGSGPASIVLDCGVRTPLGAPVLRVVKASAPDGGAEEIVLGEQGAFYTIDQVTAQLSGRAQGPSAPSVTPAPAAAAAAPRAGALAQGQDYRIVLTPADGRTNVWKALAELGALRSLVREASGSKALPSVVVEAAGSSTPGILVVSADGRSVLSGASAAQLQLQLRSSPTAGAAAPPPPPPAMEATPAAPAAAPPPPEPAREVPTPVPAREAERAPAAPAGRKGGLLGGLLRFLGFDAERRRRCACPGRQQSVHRGGAPAPQLDSAGSTAKNPRGAAPVDSRSA